MLKTRAKWSRWGWGGCEGYGLEIGDAFRCSVVFRPGGHPNEPPAYAASINSNEYGRYPDREAAMRALEEQIESRMAGVLRDWTIYQALKDLNEGQVPRIGLHAKRR